MIPAYNEASRLPGTLARVIEHLSRRGTSWEIVIVDDGSIDDTAGSALGLGGAMLNVVRNEENRGKGFSVRRGMLLARGKRRLMTDADLSTPIEDLDQLLTRMDEGYDVVIASRALPGARILVHQTRFRETMGRVFNALVQLIALPGVQDTQCGFKLFTAQAAIEAFRVARLDGFCFDVEALYVARKRGRRIAEVPVTWRNDAASRVTLLRGFAAYLDLVRIRVNDMLGRYEAPQGL